MLVIWSPRPATVVSVDATHTRCSLGPLAAVIDRISPSIPPGSAKLVTVPCGVIRPTLSALAFVNQTFPSGPAVRWLGPEATGKTTGVPSLAPAAGVGTPGAPHTAKVAVRAKASLSQRW